MKLTVLAALIFVSSNVFAAHDEVVYLSYCLDNKVVRTEADRSETVIADCEVKGETCQQVTIDRVGHITSFGVCEKQD